jgi:hypothetical protein
MEFHVTYRVRLKAVYLMFSLWCEIIFVTGVAILLLFPLTFVLGS